MPCRSVCRVAEKTWCNLCRPAADALQIYLQNLWRREFRHTWTVLWCLWFPSHSSFCCDSYWSRHRCVIFLVVEVVELNNFVLVDLINHLNLVDATLSVGFRSSSSFEAGKSFGLTSDWDWETAARLLSVISMMISMVVSMVSMLFTTMGWEGVGEWSLLCSWCLILHTGGFHWSSFSILTGIVSEGFHYMH